MREEPVLEQVFLSSKPPTANEKIIINGKINTFSWQLSLLSSFMIRNLRFFYTVSFRADLNPEFTINILWYNIQEVVLDV